MLEWEGRSIPETLPEIVDPAHTVVIMHDIQNDNTGPDGVFARDNRRIDVAHLLGPIAAFLDVARANGVRVMYTQYTNLPGLGTAFGGFRAKPITHPTKSYATATFDFKYPDPWRTAHAPG